MIGAVLVPGGKAPKLVRHDDLRRMKDGSVIVDVAVDQGGCVESARPTTHNDPTYTVHGLIHYCVANMPGAVPRTSTLALTNATFPYRAAPGESRGWQAACLEDPDLALGVNIAGGRVTYEAVAQAFGSRIRASRGALRVSPGGREPSDALEATFLRPKSTFTFRRLSPGVAVSGTIRRLGGVPPVSFSPPIPRRPGRAAC